MPDPDVTLSSTNIALKATALASSYADGQAAAGAIDGIIKGYTAYTGDTYDGNEWASDGEGAGAWLRLTFDEPEWVARVVLYDRPNQMDRIKGATVTFSDGTTADVAALVNDASFGTYIDLSAPIYTSYVLITVTSVSQTTSSAGLSEVLVYGPASTSGLTTPVNLASGGTATASSSSGTSTPASAIDGLFGGYSDADGDTTDAQEWSSDGEGTGAWLKVVLAAAGSSVNKVVLSDRPNTNDWVTGGTLSFSDGSSVAVGALTNDGASVAVAFTARAVDWVMFTVTKVASTTSNIGLSEIQVFNSNGAVSVVSKTATATATSSVSKASTVVINPGTSSTVVSSVVSSTVVPATTKTTTRKTTTTTTTTMTTTTAAGVAAGAAKSAAASLAKASSLASAQASKVASLASKAAASASKVAASKASSLIAKASKAAASKASAAKAAASKASASAASASRKAASLAKAKSVKAAATKKKTTTTKKKKKASTTKKVAAVKGVTIKAANPAASKAVSLSKSHSLSKSKSASKSKSLAKSKSLSKVKAAAASKAAKGHKRFGKRDEEGEDNEFATATAGQAAASAEGEWDFESYEPAAVDAFNAAEMLAHPFVFIPDEEAEGGTREEVERRERRRARVVRA